MVARSLTLKPETNKSDAKYGVMQARQAGKARKKNVARASAPVTCNHMDTNMAHERSLPSSVQPYKSTRDEQNTAAISAQCGAEGNSGGGLIHSVCRVTA